MKNYTVRLYEPADAEHWNAFMAKAKNATFLFDRGFMGYHGDRFEDCSLVVEADGGKWAAVLPLAVSGSNATSHPGLTYGGLVFSQKLRLAEVVGIFKEILYFLFQKDITTLRIKPIPSIYCNVPAEEPAYALFLSQATLLRRDMLAVLEPKAAAYSDLRKRGIKKGRVKSLVVKETEAFDDFWNAILIPNLAARHGVTPVHTLAEIQLLKERFPSHIRQFNVYDENRIVAGTTIFESANVAHAQYIMADASREENGSLDYLFHTLISEVFRDKKYFDFGISNEQQGLKLNTGLSYWKESFGAGGVVQDLYEIPTAHYELLNHFEL